MSTKRIKVTGCSVPTYWYHDKIGEEYNVVPDELFDKAYPDSYHIGFARFIAKADCEVINE